MSSIAESDLLERTSWRWGLILALGLLAGCGTTRMTDTQRTATEQLLLSNAVDQAVSQLDFHYLAGKTVFLDPQYLENVADRGYLISSLRQQLLACGCILQEERAKAVYVVEARSGAVGTDRHSLLLGVPQMTVPTFLPGQPSLIPEIPFAKKTDQQAVAKIAVFAYNRVSGQRAWQSGTMEANSNASDTWLLGAGPFRKGSILHGTEFAGAELPVPDLGMRGSHDLEPPSPVPPVTAAALWPEPPMPRPNLASVLVPVPGGGLSAVVNILVQSALAESNQLHPVPQEAVALGTAETGSVKKDNAGSPPAAPHLPPPLPPPAASANIGGQAESEPSKVFSSGWGFQPGG
jgi:hypothetical protein